MKYILTLLFCLVLKLALAQPPAGSRVEIVSRSLDTNKIIYDEQGKEIKYYKYMPMLRSGLYSIRYKGDPSLPETTGQLIKMTPEARLRVDSIRMYGLTTPNSGILKVGTALDVAPLSMALQKDFFSKKPVLMVFWSPDIPRSIPLIIQLSSALRNYNPDSLVVLLITTADKERAEVLGKTAASMNARMISNAADIFDFYQVSAMPFCIVADGDRIIRYNATGTGPSIAGAAKQVLDEVLGIVPPGTYTMFRDPKYLELATAAFKLFKNKEYPEAAKAYEDAFEQSKGTSSPYEALQAAGAWAHSDNKDKAFYYLDKLVSVHKWKNLSALSDNEHLASLHNDKRWEEIIERVKKNTPTP